MLFFLLLYFYCSFNQVKPKNDVEVRVYEVLSHKNWGASSTLMNEIAQDTFDYERCELVMVIVLFDCFCFIISTANFIIIWICAYDLNYQKIW